MKIQIRKGTHMLALSGAGLLATLLVTQANAGCMAIDANSQVPAYLQQQPWLLDHSQRAIAESNVQEGASSLRKSDTLSSSFGAASIVGLWKFSFLSKGNTGIPDGVVLDSGLATWHGDGTELINSLRPPSSGNFCMGVWKQTAGASFKLNHFALAWDPTGTVFIGPANLRSQVTLSRGGNSYAGTFTLDQYAEDGTTVLAHVAGTVSATRIAVD